MGKAKLLKGAAVAAVLMALPAAGHAQDAGSITAVEEISAADIIGSEVVNSADEMIGTVDDLLLSAEGEVTAATLSVGGFLGIGDKLVAVPYADVDIRPDGSLFYNATREELDSMPIYEEGQLAAIWDDLTTRTGQAIDELDESTADERAEYEARMRETLDEWDARMADARASGQEMSNEAGARVQESWDSLQVRWDELQNASGEAWEDTKRALDDGVTRMQAAWGELTEER